MRAIVSFGSNLGNREKNLALARDALANFPQTIFREASEIRETEPLDVPTEFAHLKFLNQLAIYDTRLSAEEFSTRMHAVEDALGRVRTVRNGPRTIDLDLIDFGGLFRDTPELMLPHPRAKFRDFVMEPLHELGAHLGFAKNEIDLFDIREELARGVRIVLLTRHAERPKIDNEDPSFGGDLALTDEGLRTSERFGEILRGSVEDENEIQFLSSPLTRTQLTARQIANGLGLKKNREIPCDARIGNSSAFIADEHAVWELFRDGRFFEKMGDYLANGEQIGFAPLASAADEFESYVFSRIFARTRLAILTTHDVYLAAFSFARGVQPDLTRENWPCFLDAVAIFIDPNGTRRYAFVRAGLSTLICGV